jgi:hypothetical protein
VTELELEESESVVERGTCKVIWFLRRNDAWIRAPRWPGAVVKTLPSGAGTVWQVRIALGAEVGTRLLRVEVRPAPIRRQTPLEYLEKTPPRRERTKRAYFRVGVQGKLEREV